MSVVVILFLLFELFFFICSFWRSTFLSSFCSIWKGTETDPVTDWIAIVVFLFFFLYTNKYRWKINRNIHSILVYPSWTYIPSHHTRCVCLCMYGEPRVWYVCVCTMWAKPGHTNTHTRRFCRKNSFLHAFLPFLSQFNSLTSFLLFFFWFCFY